MLDESNTMQQGRTPEELDEDEWEDEELLEDELSPEQERELRSGDVWRHRSAPYIGPRDLHQVRENTFSFFAFMPVMVSCLALFCSALL